MNVLVTGADGQLGKTVAKLAEGCGNNYIFCDVSELDITDESSVEACVLQNDIDVILNCAAYTNVDKAEDSPELADAVNHTAVAGMARIAKKHDVVLIHISTDYVFGAEPYNKPCREEQQGTPTGVYGLTKLHGEERIKAVGGDFVIRNYLPSLIAACAAISSALPRDFSVNTYFLMTARLSAAVAMPVPWKPKF